MAEDARGDTNSVGEREVVTTISVEFRYPAAGDATPPIGATVQILTKGGTCIIGTWKEHRHFIGWAPFPKRNKDKERLIGVGV